MSRVPIHHNAYTCPTSRSTLTVDAWAVVHDDDGTPRSASPRTPGIGPGVGPHQTPNVDTVYRWGWMLVTLGGVMRRTLHLPTLVRAVHDGDPALVQIPGQLSIHDGLEVHG